MVSGHSPGGQRLQTVLWHRTSRVYVLASKYPSIIRILQRTEVAVYELFMQLSIAIPQCFFVVSCYGITNASEILQTERQPLESNNEGTAEPLKVSGCIRRDVRTLLTLQKPRRSCSFKLVLRNKRFPTERTLALIPGTTLAACS
ncbi:uncharacterized protein PRD47_015320 [Ara ararauna]